MTNPAVSAVRTGCCPGSSSTLWNAPSRVSTQSSHGTRNSGVKISPGRITAGQKMAGMSSPPIWMSQPGIIRTAPSSQPMYQSGWAAVVASQARYGP